MDPENSEPVQGPKLPPHRQEKENYFERAKEISKQRRIERPQVPEYKQDPTPKKEIDISKAKLKRLEREPVVRERELGLKKADISLKKKELDIAREQRETRLRQLKESTPVRGAQFVSKGAKQTVRGIQKFQRYQQRQAYQRVQRQYYQPSPLGIAPGSISGISGSRLSTIGLPQRTIGPSSGLSPSTSKLPIHSIGSIRSSGYGIGPSVQMPGKIPRGLIKSYWSKKVKTLAKANIKQHGPEEGIARTYQMANELGWKIQ